MEVRLIDRQENPALVDLADLLGVRVQVVAGKRTGMDDEAFEDAGLAHHVLDDANSVSVAVIDGRSIVDRDVGDRGPERLR